MTGPQASVTGKTLSWDGDDWTELGKLNTPRAYHACAEVDGTLYAVGGADEYGHSLASVEKMNLSTGVWSDGPVLPYSADSVQAVTIQGNLYIVGGLGTGGKICRMKGNRWEIVATSGYDDYRVMGSSPPVLSGGQIEC